MDSLGPVLVATDSQLHILAVIGYKDKTKKVRAVAIWTLSTSQETDNLFIMLQRALLHHV